VSVNVDHLSTDVIPEPEPLAGNSSKPNRLEQEEMIREAHAQWLRNRYRTAAEGFDD
jgi:hypothetical protein